MKNSDQGKRSGTTAAVAAVVAAMATVAVPQAVRAQAINVTVDGEVVPFGGQPPVQRLGSVLVPLRGVFEKLGATVAYDPPTKTILAVRGGTSVTLRIGEAVATVNGQQRALSLPAQAVNGATLVPLRFVSEALGAGVEWRAASRTVVINTTGGGTSSEGSAALPGGSSAATVESLTHNGADKALRAGEALTVTLRGTPGGTASFTVPGIDAARSIAMQESATPGLYTGSFTVPKGVNVKGAAVLATLKKSGVAAPVIQAGQALTVDAVGPTLANLSPAPDAALPPGKPLLYGTVSDAGTGVNAAGARLLVNGKDVTGKATITDAFFSYQPEADLPNGKNTVTVVVPDAAGNETRRDWAFTVTPNEALIQGLTFSPDAQTLGPGDELTVRLTAKPGGTARFSIGGTVKDRPMREESAGVYVGTYTVKKGDSLAKAPISASFTSATGRTVTQTAEQSITIAAGAPEAPVITAPAAGAATGGTVTLTGKAAPNATVRYHVEYSGTLLVLPTNGTVVDGEVKADAQGNWSVPDVKLSAPIGVSRLAYQATVVVVGAAGEESEPVSVQFKR